MYNIDKWIDYGDYYIYEDDASNMGTKQANKFRVTGSRVNSCVGGSGGNPFKTKDDIALEIVGIKKQEETEEAKERIAHGIFHENSIRNWYNQSINYSKPQFVVKSLNLAIPKFDMRLGTAPDGGIYENNKLIGLLEIKCPKIFYQSLKDYLELGNPYTPEYLHIYRSHYDQMQMCMAIYNVEWCDYVVCCIVENRIFLERVTRNREYWNNLYLKIQVFIETKLQPLINDININPMKYPWNPKK